MKRRKFFRGTGLAMASMMLPAPSIAVLGAANTGANRYELVAQKGAQHLAGQANPQTELLLYGNSTPGPLLVGRKSDMLEVEFINRLEMASTIHWHGIKESERDGWRARAYPAKCRAR